MPFPKVTRYVRDGEVDPGVAAVAEAIKATFAIGNVAWEAAGVSRNAALYDIEKVAYFIAASGAGIFSPYAFKAEGGVFLPQQGMYVLRKYLNMGVRSTDGTSLRPAFWEEQWYDPQHAEADYAEKLYQRLLAAQPDGELMVEALMFYDPSGAFGVELQKADKPVEKARDMALKVASAVPPMGRKWLMAKMLSSGMSPSKARENAYIVYKDGGNLVGWSAFDERRDAVRSLLIKVDPDVSDEQVEAVAKSALPLSVIESTFTTLSYARSTGAETSPGPGDETSVESAKSSRIGIGTWALVAALGVGGVVYWRSRSR